jgi:hypothetical protein
MAIATIELLETDLHIRKLRILRLEEKLIPSKGSPKGDQLKQDTSRYSIPPPLTIPITPSGLSLQDSASTYVRDFEHPLKPAPLILSQCDMLTA